MDNIVQGHARFREEVFPREQALYRQLAQHGQQPKALIISCADSRVVPELITQAGPGELFVCRNAGNIIPPYGQNNGGVVASVEYAVKVLGVRDIVVCGHSGCGAMHALMHPETLEGMPAVQGWLRHAHAARSVVCEAYPAGMDAPEALRALAMENVVTQLNNLRTHPSVAARIAGGQVALHGWFFDVETGTVLALCGDQGRFEPLSGMQDLPVALAPAPRAVAAAPRRSAA